MSKTMALRIALTVATTVLFGCAGSSMFTTYPSRMEPVRADIAKGDTDSAEDPIEDILDSSNVSDRVLYLQEHGRISQIGENDIDESIESYSEAIAIVKERDQQAVVRSSDVGASAASIATSDNAIPYEPPPHERAFLRTFQAMNYLQQGDFESARVEVLNLQYEQEAIRKRQEQEIEELKAKLAAKNPDGSPPTRAQLAEAQKSQGFIDLISRDPTLRGAQRDMASGVGDVRSARENAYSYYVSGLIYELNEGEVDQDNALTSYTKALEIAPNNSYVGDAAYRLARKLDTSKPALKRIWHERGEPKLEDVPEGSGRLVILHEQGLVMPRSQIKFPIPVAGTVNNIALPYYPKDTTRPIPIKVSVDGEEMGATQPLTDVRKLAVKHLVDDYHAIVIRQALRLGAKAIVQVAMKEAVDAALPGAGFLVSTTFGVVDLVVTSADMRTWLTLPANIQVASFYVPAGERKVQLHESDGNVAEVEIEVRENGLSVIRSVELIGPTTYTEHMASN